MFLTNFPHHSIHLEHTRLLRESSTSSLEEKSRNYYASYYILNLCPVGPKSFIDDQTLLPNIQIFSNLILVLKQTVDKTFFDVIRK